MTCLFRSTAPDIHPLLTTTRLATIVLLAVALASCASTRNESSTTEYGFYADPDFAERRYRTIAVHFDIDRMDRRSHFEECLATEARLRGYRSVPTIALLPPTRTWDSAARARTLAASDVEALLRVRLVDEWETTRWIPQTSETKEWTSESGTIKDSGKADSTKPQKRRTESSSSTTTRTKVDGGYEERTTWRRYEVRLLDLATGRTAWIGNLTRRYWPGGETAEIIVDELVRDAMVRQS